MTRRKKCPEIPTIECQLNCPYVDCKFDILTSEEIQRQDEFDKKESEPLLTDSQRLNIQKQKIRSAKHYQNHKEDILKRNKEYCKNHKEEIALKASERRNTDRYRAKKREYARVYRSQNRDKCNAYQREYRRKKSSYVSPEKRIYEFLKQYFIENQYAPSCKEIAEGIGLKNTTDINKYLLRLKDMGLIDGQIGSSRAFRLNCFDLVERRDKVGNS